MKKIISDELLKKYNLWLWDWDDTLIDTTTYYIKSMEPKDIMNRSNEDLDREVPNWRYFKLLIPYLVKNGVRVGIVSFGTYKIIRAYMDLIFGINQRYFTQTNLIALCRDSNGAPTEFYPNKNVFIDRIMNFYKLENYSKVILFDDRMTNISDAIKLGITGIKIIGKDDDKLNERIKTGKCNEIYLDTLFSQKIILNIEKTINHSKNVLNVIKTTNYDEDYNYDSVKNRYKNINIKKLNYYKNNNFGSLGTRKNKYKLGNNPELQREQNLIDTIDDSIIQEPRGTNMYNLDSLKDLEFKKFVRPEFEYLKKHPESECPHQFELFTNKTNNNKNYNQNNNQNNNKKNLFINKENLQKHKKKFLLVFISSLLFCLYLLKNKKKNKK